MLKRTHLLKLRERRKGDIDKPLPKFRPFVVVPKETPTVYKPPSSVGSLSSFNSRKNGFSASPPPSPTFKSPNVTNQGNSLVIPIHKPTSTTVPGKRESFRVRPSRDLQPLEASSSYSRTSIQSASATTPQKRLLGEENVDTLHHEVTTTTEVDTLHVDQQSVQSSSSYSRVGSPSKRSRTSIAGSPRKFIDSEEMSRSVGIQSPGSRRSPSIVSDSFRKSPSITSEHLSVADSQSRGSPLISRRSPSIAEIQSKRSPSITTSQARSLSPIADTRSVRSISIEMTEQPKRSPSYADTQTRRSISITAESVRSTSPVADVQREISLSVVDESKRKSPSVTKSTSSKRNSPSPSVHSTSSAFVSPIARRSPSQRPASPTLEEQQTLENSVTNTETNTTTVQKEAQYKKTDDETLERELDVDMGDDIDYTNYSEQQDFTEVEPTEETPNRQETVNSPKQNETERIAREFDVDMGDEIDNTDYSGQVDQQQSDPRERHLDEVTEHDIAVRAKELATAFDTQVHRLMAHKLGKLHVSVLHQLTSEAVRSIRNITSDPFARSVVEDYMSKLSANYDKCHSDYDQYLKITTSLEKLDKLAKKTRIENTDIERERMQIERKVQKSNKEISELDKKIDKLQGLDDFWSNVRDLVKPN